MDNARATSVGFLKASKVRNAEEAIGQSEGLLTVLRLTQADIKPAEDALQVAKRFFDTNQFSKAFYAAKKAESLAITLDERFGGYQKAAKALQSRIDRRVSRSATSASYEWKPSRCRRAYKTSASAMPSSPCGTHSR